MFEQLLGRLLAEGEVDLVARPVLDPRSVGRIEELLGDAFADYRLAVAGPLLPFDPAAAVAAAEVVVAACWFAVSTDEPDEEIGQTVRLPPPPVVEAHLSADLTLRYAAGVYRRAFGRAPDDALTLALAEVLRDWPLSGVLSAVADPPRGDLEFGGHPGLQLLYAERLADNCKPAWVPAGGRCRDVAEMVFQERGRALPAPSKEGDGE